MAFSTSYKCIQDRNIRHIYCGERAPSITWDKSTIRGIHSSPALVTTNQGKQTVLKYDGKYEISLPRAPAYDCLSSEAINIMVKRLHRSERPTEKKKKLDCDLNTTSPKYRMTNGEIKASGSRLSNQQTVNSEVRKLMNDGRLTSETIVNIKQVCQRSTKSLSMRYFPRAYKICTPKD